MIIPNEILNLIKKGKWNAKPNCRLEIELKKSYGWCGSIDLHQGPEFTDGGVISSVNEDSSVYYGTYRDGQALDIEKMDHLNADKCLMIACNYEEEAICLDYRFSNDSPRIMASNYSKTNGRWVEIASDFESFIKGLGIENKL